MKRLFFLVAAALLFPVGAFACSYADPPQRPGETYEQAWRGQIIRGQVATWDRAQVVYLARVVRLSEDLRVSKAELHPVATLKGKAPPKWLRVRYWENSCGRNAPRIGQTIVVFATRVTWRDNLLHAGQWFVLDTLTADSVEAPAIAAAVKAAQVRRLHVW